MKKNILKATLVVAFALIAGMNVYNAQQSDVMSDLALANVERWLAEREVALIVKLIVHLTVGTIVLYLGVLELKESLVLIIERNN